MKVTFVLVEPAVPGNIGATARAIKTMGFTDLRLVNTHSHLSDEARWLAHGSTDILDRAKVYQRFEDAVEDIDFCVATTAKQRMAKIDNIPVNELVPFIVQKKASIRSLAIVFGSEESGLPNAIIRSCDVAASIPMETTYPSLNLAQAVMVFAWELSGLNDPEREPIQPREFDKPHYPVFREKLIRLLETTGISKNVNLYHRILERAALLSGDDINLLLSILQRLEKR